MIAQGHNTGPIDFDQIHSANAAEQSAFVTRLLRIAADSPDVLYPYYNICSSLIRNDDHIVKWAGIDTVGMLASVDHEKKSLVQIPILFSLLQAGNLITCNHAIYALGLIALAFPEQRKKIIDELIAVGKNGFETPECRELAKGKVIEALSGMVPEIKGDADVIAFIKDTLESGHGTTAKKARRLAVELGLSDSVNPQK